MARPALLRTQVRIAVPGCFVNGTAAATCNYNGVQKRLLHSSVEVTQAKK